MDTTGIMETTQQTIAGFVLDSLNLFPGGAAVLEDEVLQQPNPKGSMYPIVRYVGFG